MIQSSMIHQIPLQNTTAVCMTVRMYKTSDLRVGSLVSVRYHITRGPCWATAGTLSADMRLPIHPDKRPGLHVIWPLKFSNSNEN